jgi:hypothetical protein
MKLDRDERTHQKTLEGTRRHETEAETERPLEEAARPPLGRPAWTRGQQPSSSHDAIHLTSTSYFDP